MTEASSKSFTSRKLDLLDRALSDPRMTAAQFRFFVYSLQGCNEATSIALLGDQAFVDNVPGCSSGDTAKTMRKSIAGLGYFSFVPGHGRRRTEYRFNWDANKQINNVIKAKADRRAAYGAAKDRAWRDRVAGPGLHVAEGDGGPGLHRSLENEKSLTGAVDRDVDHGGDRVAGPGQRVMGDPLHTLITPSTIQEADEKTREVSARETISPDQLEEQILRLIGDGDLAEGRDLADYAPGQLVRNAIERSARFSIDECREEIRNVRRQALARRDAARRAFA